MRPVRALVPMKKAPKSDKRSASSKRSKRRHHSPEGILAVDIGGSKIKVLLSGQTEPRKAASGKKFTPSDMVATVRDLARGWIYDAVSIGYPGMVGDSGPRSDTENLGPGWMGYDFAAAFGVPVRMLNDATMQALGSYEGGRMLFLGLGTGLGSALIAEKVLVSLELGQLPYKNGRALGTILGDSGLKEHGRKAWSEIIVTIVPCLMSAFVADYVVLGGGNARKLKSFPAGSRLGHNLAAFRGGFRLWSVEDLPTHVEGHQTSTRVATPTNWRSL
jgi:polyphosphate glucokinase